MVWARIDDGFPEHPKIIGLSDAAFRLHVRALCYAARALTDGMLPRAWVQQSGARKVVQELVTGGLWESTPEADSYQIHDYLEYNPARAKIVAQRETRAEVGRKGGEASGRSRREAKTNRDASLLVEANAKQFASLPVEHPSHPIPIAASAAMRAAADEPSEDPEERRLRERVDALVMCLPPAHIRGDEFEVRDHFLQVCRAYDERQVIDGRKALRPGKPWPGALHSKLRELFPEVEAATRKAAADEWHPRIENWGDLPAEVTP